MATMTKTALSELNVQVSAKATEQEGLRKEVFRIMEASASAIEGQIASAVEKARLEHIAQNDKLRNELQTAQQLLADTEEAAAIALERQVKTAVEKASADLKAQLSSQQAETERMREEFLRSKQLLTEYEQVAAERDRANQLLSEAVESQRAALGEREKVACDLQAELRKERDRLREEWEGERERISMECGELRHDRNRFRDELGRLADAAAKSDLEKARLKEECEKLNRALASMESATRDQQETDISVLEEAARVETVIQEISQSIENPETELSAIIRKNVERAQLDAYLRGLRFSCGRK
jgi:chromosome segregation ATPase